MTVTAICSVQFIWKDKLYAGHALCVVRHTILLQNINNAQSFTESFHLWTFCE